MPEVFAARKGYPLWAALPAVVDGDVGARTEKARLDFADVRTSLAEERYFRPIFDWNASKGRIYACDSAGRGKDPVEFGDNFRAARWYTAPGHDAPGGQADFIKNKVSASVAHFYKRPRVWLEGYRSFGWGATPERLLFASNDVFKAFCERPIRWETLEFAEPFERAATVALEIEPEPGVCGGAVFPEPIRLGVGVGTNELGDWNVRGVLVGYSGGAKYEKTFVWKNGENDVKPANERVWLELGSVGASCRVVLNGREIGDLPTPPWRLDVSDALRPGENRLEVLVFNTLANYYADLPSLYKGSAPSGLFGPVEIRRETSFELREIDGAAE